MARLGRYEYPEIGLTRTVDLGRRIARDFGGEVSRTGLARGLGMSERGGAFGARLNALRLWRVCTGRGTVRVTEEGLRAAEPRSAGEAETALRALAQSVPLFAQIARRVGGRIVDDTHLGLLLEEITGAGRLEVSRRVGPVGRLLNEVLVYLGPEQRDGRLAGSIEPGEEPAAPGTAQRPQEVEADRIELTLSDGHLSLPESVAGVDAAMLVLRARRDALAARLRASGAPRPPEPPF